MKTSLKDKLEGNELDLSLNELSEVPVKELAALPKATHVDLSCNKLMALPISFSTSLTFLIRLDLSKNLLTELPENFGNLKLLQYLDLYGNQLCQLPVSFCQLKNLKWLDLKNNPLNSALKAVAGDCLDEKQCQECAKKVVLFMQNIDSQLERERQKRLKEERDQDRARRYQAEKEVQRQKELKKAEREKRKAEQRLKYLEKMQQSSADDEINELQENGNTVNEKEVRGEVKRRRTGAFCGWLLVLLLATPFILLTANVALKWLNGHPIHSMDDLKTVTKYEYAVLRNQTEVALEVTLAKGHQYWKLMLVEFSHVSSGVEAMWQSGLGTVARFQKTVIGLIQQWLGK